VLIVSKASARLLKPKGFGLGMPLNNGMQLAFSAIPAFFLAYLVEVPLPRAQ